jgi:hypothetical protein
MIMNFKESKTSSGKYTAALNENAKKSCLHITTSLLSNTASYMCMVNAPCSPGTCSQYPNLLLESVKKAEEV